MRNYKDKENEPTLVELLKHVKENSLFLPFIPM